MNLSPLEVFKVIMGEGTSKQNLIVFDFRLPRIVLSILVGALVILIADTLTRTISFGADVPTGIIIIIYWLPLISFTCCRKPVKCTINEKTLTHVHAKYGWVNVFFRVTT
ncbi:hypothetical protein [Paenibacillus polymyxa]|uniref:hypothetical protein n=1 Tax=Paenibacillus polymyxa TaxID=1406 RepID=UPI00287F970D|nr:hypothetical protein [Paenibacillus polymyxa]